MVSINSYWVNRTIPLVKDGKLDILITRSVDQDKVQPILRRLYAIDDQIGLDFNFVKSARRADVLIQYRRLPTAVNAWAAFSANKWKLQVDPRTFYAEKGSQMATMVAHELGHALGLEHHLNKGLMFERTSGLSKMFSIDEITAINSVWGI
jgi:hypothetical protein